MEPLKNRDQFLKEKSDMLHQALLEHPFYVEVEMIVRKLSSRQRICYLTGGCVRDFILGRKPYDIDLTTDATEEEILTLFPQALLLGQSFGVYKIPFQSDSRQQIDLTVFRKEDGYIDGRRPTRVERSTPEEDSARRDFTINSIFYDLKIKQIIDYQGGLEDLKNRRLRCVGRPQKRFEEDRLRLLRLVRFAAQLGFEIDSETYQQALLNATFITQISGERFYEELQKASQGEYCFQFWQDPLTQKLFQSFGYELQLSEMTLDKERLACFAPQKKLFMELFFYGKDFLCLESFCRQKLKVSRDDLQFVSVIVKEFQLITKNIEFLTLEKNRSNTNSQFEISDLVFDDVLRLEKYKEDRVVDIFNFHELVGAVYSDSAPYLSQIKMSYLSRPEALIGVSDVLGRVPDRYIKDVIDQVRRLQLRKRIKTKEEALVFIQSVKF